MADRTVVVKGTSYTLTCLEAPQMIQHTAFFEKVFHRSDFTLDWLKGKYGGRFGGLSGFAAVAMTDRGEIAASYGMLPWPIRYGDRIEVAGQAVDVATDPNHRRRGLFALLVETALARCREAGAHFIIGFTPVGGETFPLYIRHHGYTHIHDMVEYRCRTRTVWAERIARRLPPIHGLYRRYLDRTLDALAPQDPVLENSLVTEGFAATHHSREFFDYKSFAGSRVLGVEGGRAWLKVRRGMLVGDLEAATGEGLDRSLRALEGVARRNGIDEIIFQTSHDTRFTRLFPERYRTVPCFKVVYQDIASRIPPDRLRFTFGDLDNF